MTVTGTLFGEPNRAGGSDPFGHWLVQSRSGCARMVVLLDQYPLRAKKHRDYVIWREAVHTWANVRRGPGSASLSTWARMAVLKQELISARAYV
jgi:hypothetical protein